MRVTSVELHPSGSSEVAVLSFRDPSRQNPLNIKKITGLDAEDLIAKFYGGSGSSAKYNLSMEKRDVGIQIGLNPRFALGESFSSLRDDIYRLIASSRTGQVQIQFKNGENVVAAVSGFVVKVEAPQFEKNQEVILSIECRDPILRALNPVAVDMSAMDPAATVINDILSTAPHGFAFELAFTGPMATLSISNPGDPSWSFGVSPAGGFIAGDHLFFSSDYNNKYLYMVRTLVQTHLADKILPNSVWPLIFPGVNNFALSTPGNLDWVSLSYFPTYWGV